MGLIELMLIAIGLSMDAFAVSLCKGLGMKGFLKRSALIIALFFGGFQALMPLAGWLIGRQFEQYITRFDHWVAFGLLAFIGVKMLFQAFREAEADATFCPVVPNLRELTLLAVATSIDALAVGITFAFLKVSILPSVLVIGMTTFMISVAGVYAGHRFGARHQKAAEITGGAVLVLIGVKILIEHLGSGG